MSERNLDDVDWATAAEQSSEDDEAQEGNVLAAEEHSVEPAEHEALHVEDSNDVVDLDAVLDALAEVNDPEADAVVDDALEIDEAAEVEAAALAIGDENEVEQEEADSEADVTPYDGEEPEAADVDPYDAFRAELRTLPGKWFVIHSYAGFERKVKANIEQRKGSLDVADFIYQVEVPMEDVVEIKNGQRKMVTRVRIPGYVLVRMDLNEDSWSVVRHTPGVTGFVGNAHNPTPLRAEEAFNMLKSLVEVKDTTPAKSGGGKGGQTARAIPAEVDFEIGETITIKEGSFAGLPGSISEIKPESGKLTVLVSLFERETPVELSFDQVTKL
ncbi:MAG TPA: transcription termination/antitermination protein NusG [Mycetocola sp.]|uniref:transcription termination/antitermination protein NusG n=1 Tax=Mycetocola sp. TaxID=1871042 RepID=UPI002619F610|nr:transcription termination/antitermination protein NusG [Mycetocola sp.]MCU1559369.1 transcription termination/antitermination protein NusG [Mycetocola sp.]HEV7849371.1 transcription termination/antitermination protein NusG [Mycetocola sp.]